MELPLSTDGTVIQSHVDSEQLDRVEQECSELLYQQRLSYNERWYSSLLFTRGILFLRGLGLSLSLIGIALNVYYLIDPGSCPRWLFAEAYLLFFVVMGVFFYVLPRIQARIHARFKTAGRRGSQKLARRMVAQARKLLPFDAKVELTGDLISYSRGKDGQWKQIWSRKPKGFAVLGRNVALLFRKPTSLIPTMLVLHRDPEAMEPVLKHLGLGFKKVV